MQLSPSPSLSGFVKHYLILESERDIYLNYRLFSDGNPGLVFHFKNPLIQFDAGNPDGNTQPNSFIYGQITHYNDLKSNGKMGMLVVVLQPHGIYSLLGMDASELNNRIIKLSYLFGQEAMDLEDQVLNTQNTHQIIQSIEGFLFKKYSFAFDTDPVFAEALDLIYGNRGMITIDFLLKKIPVTERQLERKFKKYIGTTPKNFTDIIRFQHFLKRLQIHSPGEKISDAVYDGGYYDPSHLNNYFKRTTGVTPRQYKLEHHLLAVNFMQLSKIT
jgi:AraC-like DNA-binding protein